MDKDDAEIQKVKENILSMPYKDKFILLDRFQKIIEVASGEKNKDKSKE